MQTSFHKSTVLYISGKALNLLMAPLALILLPGLMGDKGYGHFGYWFGLISLYMILIDFGSQAMSRRYLPELLLKNKTQAKTLFYRSQLLKLVPLSLFVVALLFSGSRLLQFSLLVTALAAAIVTSVADLFYAAQKMGWHSACQLSRRFLRLILVPIGFLSWGLNGLLIALLLSEVVPLLFWRTAVKQFTANTAPLEKPFWTYYKVGILGFIGIFISTFIGRFPVLAAQWSGLSIEHVGHVALSIDLTYFALKELINAISESIFPRLVQLKTQNNHAGVQALVSANYHFVNLASLYVIALGIPLAPAFLLMLGDQFYYITPALQWMLVAVLLGNLNFIHVQILFIYDAVYKFVLAQIIGLITLMLLFYFIYQEPINTFRLVIILSASMTTISISSFLFSRKYINSTSSIKYFVRLIPAAVASFSLLWVWQPRGILMSLAAGLVASFIYVALVLLFRGLAHSDLSAIKKIMHVKRGGARKS